MKCLIGICLAGSLSACATTNSPYSSTHAPSANPEAPVPTAPITAPLAFPSSTSDLRIVKDLADQLPRDSTLVVFDIDDTLLTTEKLGDGSHAFYGGDRWYVWQSELDKSSEYKVGNCLIELITYNYRLLPMSATQADAPDIVRQIRSDKLLLTSRGPANWDSTIRELRGAEYSAIAPSVSMKDFDFMHTEGNRTDAVIFRDGIMMTSGFNKGHMLREILRRSGKTYANVILVDDTQRHIDRMRAELKNSGTTFYGTRYTRIKDDDKNPDGTSKLPTVTEGQMDSHRLGFSAMKKLLAQMSPTTFQRFEEGCPNTRITMSPSL